MIQRQFTPSKLNSVILALLGGLCIIILGFVLISLYQLDPNILGEAWVPWFVAGMLVGAGVFFGFARAMASSADVTLRINDNETLTFQPSSGVHVTLAWAEVAAIQYRHLYIGSDQGVRSYLLQVHPEVASRNGLMRPITDKGEDWHIVFSANAVGASMQRVIAALERSANAAGYDLVHDIKRTIFGSKRTWRVEPVK